MKMSVCGITEITINIFEGKMSGDVQLTLKYIFLERGCSNIEVDCVELFAEQRWDKYCDYDFIETNVKPILDEQKLTYEIIGNDYVEDSGGGYYYDSTEKENEIKNRRI